MNEILSKNRLKELDKVSSGLSAYAPEHLRAWQDFFKFEVLTVDGYACIFAHHDGICFMYYPPLGKEVPADIWERCFALLDKRNHDPRLSRIEHVPLSLRSKLDSSKYHFQRKDDEYCYWKKDLIDVKGDRYKSFRSTINQASKHYAPEAQPFEAAMKEECLQLWQKWAERRIAQCVDEVDRLCLEDSRKVHEQFMNMCDQEGVLGRVLTVDKEICGYTFGYPLDERIFCVAVEVTDVTKRGLAAFLFHSFCKDTTLERFSFINTMDDMGSQTLRQAKMACRPVLFLSSYVISRKGLL